MFKRLLVISRGNPWGGEWREEKCCCKLNSTSTQPPSTPTSPNWSSLRMMVALTSLNLNNFVKLIICDHDHGDNRFYTPQHLFCQIDQLWSWSWWSLLLLNTNFVKLIIFAWGWWCSLLLLSKPHWSTWSAKDEDDHFHFHRHLPEWVLLHCEKAKAKLREKK